MEEARVLATIPFTPDRAKLLARLQITDDSPMAVEVKELADEAGAIARPKAVYRIAYVEAKEEAAVIIDGVRLESRVLRVNLEKAHRVFAYVATCGRELERWMRAMGDPLRQLWAGAVMELALGAAYEALNADVDALHEPGKTARMNPGSLKDWPLPQQRPLFSLIGDVEALVGVTLTDSFLMLPTKSVSGIRFPTEVSYENCQLCSREACPGRRSPYDPDLYARRFALRAGR